MFLKVNFNKPTIFHNTMKKFWSVVNYIIRKADIILLVLDSRFPELSLNEEIIDKAKNKPLIYVYNKCDLISKKEAERLKRKNSIFVSTKERWGITILKKKILEIGQGKQVTVGVLGYPNTGKSSLINALKGRKSAKTSSRAGYTKGKQLIKVSEKIFLIDSPGVFPFKEKDETNLALINAIDFNEVKEPEYVVHILIGKKKHSICKYYKVEEKEDIEEILEDIAIKFRKLKKGGIPNILETARMILKDWQQGKIKIHLESSY